MVESFWLALAMFLVLEGVGPMLFPNKWKKYIQSISELPTSQIQIVGGILVIAGIVTAWALFT